MSRQLIAAHAAPIAWVFIGAAACGQAQKAAEAAAAAPPVANGPIVKVRQGEAQGIVADGVVGYSDR